jgi:hypothetical protein
MTQGWRHADIKEDTHFVVYGEKAVTFEFDSISPAKYKETITHYHTDNWKITIKYCNRYRYLQAKSWEEWKRKKLIEVFIIDSLAYNKRM